MTDYNFTCPACGAAECKDLPIPHRSRSMISDGGLISNPLKRRSCNNCGHGFHAQNFSEQQVRKIYGGDYAIGLRDAVAEVERSVEYGRQIAAFLARHAGKEADFSKIIEFGCGSGTLLNYLTESLGAQMATGVEPSSRVAAHARSIAKNRVSIHEGFAEQFEEGYHRYKLCISVNVIEHTHDPHSFLRACRQVMDETGVILVVCPDGETVGSELLFYDHISNFTSASLMMFAESANLRVIESSSLVGSLQGFRIHLLRLDDPEPERKCGGFELLSEERSAYLSAWCRMQGATERALDGRKYAIFGTGEYSDLLQAYSPSIVDNAEFFVRDRPVEADLYGKRVVSTEDFLSFPRMPLIAAVHERSWRLVRERFRSESVPIFHSFEVAKQDAIR